MVNLIAILTLFGSLIGMSIIIVRKISVLSELSPEEIAPGFLKAFKQKVKENGAVKVFSGEVLLQKLLSKIRILTLKTENKTSKWLTKSRQRALKKKDKFSNDYWRKLKK